MFRTSITCVCLVLGVVPISARAADLPPALAVIPGDAAGFVAVDVPAVLKSPLCDELHYALGAIKPAELAAFAKKFPIDPLTIEHVVIVMPTGATVTEPLPDLHPTAVSALAIFDFSKPFDPAALTKNLSPYVRPKSYRGRVYQFDEESWTGLLMLPGNRAVVFGAEDSLIWLIDRLEKGEVDGPLSPARAEAVGHTVFFALNPGAAVPPKLDLPPILKPLTEARRICIAIDLGKTIKGSVDLHYADAEGAAAGEKAVKTTIELGRGKLKEAETALKEIIDKPDDVPGMVGPDEFPKRFISLIGVGALRRFDELLEKLPVERKGTMVRCSAEITVPSGGVGVAVVAIAGITALGKNANTTFQRVGSAIGGDPAETQEGIRLKKLAAAFDAYHAEHGHYPPVATTAKDGTPLLSWRVALLPYLGEKELFAQFRQNEPWDSLHNKKLIAKLPVVFDQKSIWPRNYGRTKTKVVTGPGTLFDAQKEAKKPALATILAVESGDPSPVWWTKPADRPAAPGKPPEVFADYDFSSCWVLFTDGSVKQLFKKDDAKRLPDLIWPMKRPRD